MLFLVATPIGHLKDITLRALETLQACDYILCEDTRHSLILLKHYQIQKPLISFHKFSEASKEEKIIQDLKNGQTICLISDAGTPGISDPGTRLVQRCITEGLEVSTIPGPCAAIAALSISGLETDRFQFYGFLPKQSGALKTAMQEILQNPCTTICYESPERIHKALEIIHQIDPRRKLVICRELTKKFEEHLRGNAEELLQLHTEKKFKGEIVLLISAYIPSAPSWEEMTIEDHVAKVQSDHQLSLNEAIKKVAQIRSVPKRSIYNSIHKKT